LNNQFYEELWLSAEGTWADQVVSPKVPWDERRPTGELLVHPHNLHGLFVTIKKPESPIQIDE